ncbi:hypothetical protein MLD38_012398 [Melastoma candidum]|uniref:Uncharacterized protein n=1 Tax=Melastoma candidum TaxID=119954 RepID=A0ACB9R7Z6_9MYRT|nr:hypothetical protein MLD38_012398 [Melastoma candidum]
MAPTSIATLHNLPLPQHNPPLFIPLGPLHLLPCPRVLDRPMHGADPTDTEIARRSLTGSTELSSSSFSSSVKVTAFHPKHFKTYHPSSRLEYEAGDHEVPSGPNPISNR